MDFKNIGEGMVEMTFRVVFYLLFLLIPLAIFGVWKLVELAISIFT